MFRPKGRKLVIYLTEKETKNLDDHPTKKEIMKELMKALVKAKDDFFRDQVH
ncbi:MAG: hypothetical protein ACW964_01850 [Candidatus Hodarchaeales archaeon]